MSEYKHRVKTTCKFCRREFDSFGLRKVCRDCDENMERYFLTIRAHLEEFPDASVAEICNDLDIPPALIKYYLKEERLQIKNGGRNYFLTCEKCKKSITTGRYCFQCELEVTRSEMEIVSVQNPENANIEKEIARFHSKKLFKRK